MKALKDFSESISQRIFFYGTVGLVSLNFCLFLSFALRFYSGPPISEIPTTSGLFAFVESIIGKNLSCYDFIQVLIQQICGVMVGEFKAYSTAFLIYLLLCKIWLTGYVSKEFVHFNLGLQFIMVLQIFLIIYDYQRKDVKLTSAKRSELVLSEDDY